MLTGDGDQDLYVVSGGADFQPDDPLYRIDCTVTLAEEDFKRDIKRSS